MQLIGIICNFVNEELGKSLSIKLKSFKVMKKKIIMACLALVASAAAVVGIKAYNYYSMSPLMRANLEALSQREYPDITYKSVDDYREDLFGGIMCCNTNVVGYCAHGISCSEFE